MYEAKIILDSVSPVGVRITTMQLRYWRGIHAEAKTHRILSRTSDDQVIIQTADVDLMEDQWLSRNASSSRAIPVKTMLEQVRTNPAGPLHWGKNRPGMQAREELTGQELLEAQHLWRMAADNAANIAAMMAERGVHKQVVNRILEPFQYISVIVTATEWDNFFELRDHPDAQPEIQYLARLMRAAMAESTPQMLKYGEWHLPYVRPEDTQAAIQFRQKDRITRDMPSQREISNVLRKLSVARCARVSYLTHDGQQPNVEKDIELHDKLVVSEPRHASPAEHQATPLLPALGIPAIPFNRNFRGWAQYRAFLEEGWELS